MGGIDITAKSLVENRSEDDRRQRFALPLCIPYLKAD